MRASAPKSRQPNGASSIYLGKDGRWHGRVTVGVKDDGTPDRRHVSRKTRPEVTKVVRELERQRDKGAVRKAGQSWTVKTWLTHWVENIAAAHASENTIDGYRVAVNHHLIPGLGAHRLEKLDPEHLERFYKKMQDNGSAAGTAHQAHRTIRTALNEAVRRKHLTANPASIAKAPKVEEEEVEPYSARRSSGSSPRPPSTATPPVGSSHSPSACARERCSACSGTTSTSSSASSAYVVAGCGPATSTAAATAADASPATAPRRSTPAARRRTPSPALASGLSAYPKSCSSSCAGTRRARPVSEPWPATSGRRRGTSSPRPPASL